MGKYYRPHQEKPYYAEVIKATTNPLSFFVLALLIVEAFIAAVLVMAGFSNAVKLGLTITGIVLFVAVCAAVFVLAWKKPESLTFDKNAHLAALKSGTPDAGEADVNCVE